VNARRRGSREGFVTLGAVRAHGGRLRGTSDISYTGPVGSIRRRQSTLNAMIQNLRRRKPAASATPADLRFREASWHQARVVGLARPQRRRRAYVLHGVCALRWTGRASGREVDCLEAAVRVIGTSVLSWRVDAVLRLGLHSRLAGYGYSTSSARATRRHQRLASSASLRRCYRRVTIRVGQPPASSQVFRRAARRRAPHRRARSSRRTRPRQSPSHASEPRHASRSIFTRTEQ
jgi:hypothetical protein